MRAGLLLALLVLPGCLVLEGEDRAFPDGSRKVAAIRVNAYAADEPAGRVGVVETTGVGADGAYHAFRGEMRVVLEEQRPAADGVSYAHVKDWVVDVEEDDFSSPTHPRHRHVIPHADFPHEGTYRVRVTARVDGRLLPEATALFGYGVE